MRICMVRGFRGQLGTAGLPNWLSAWMVGMGDGRLADCLTGRLAVRSTGPLTNYCAGLRTYSVISCFAE